jgi:large repetitive protein
VTFTATVGGSGGIVPTGFITFIDIFNSQTTTLGTFPLTTMGSNGQASLTISTLVVGTHSIQASYGGDNNRLDVERSGAVALCGPLRNG